MKNIYILIFIGALIACSNKDQEKTPSNLNHESNVNHAEMYEQQSSAISEVSPASESKVITDKAVDTKDDLQANQISCLNKNITDWYGFDEANAEPKCENLRNFRLTSYKCDISKNAFGADKDALLLENQDKRIFAYSNAKDCNEILEIRNSNAP
ncbi:hypothetical protein Q5X37_09035 [Acinetobacter baumannii]|uniref:hypothetical protein n=1 Tax=Acinetobacter baumannii TaxID=470 RepID=UPI000DE76BCC|nr:hypothetical protein [Acinetobacter baumannii]MDC4878786.1 hypothetical protein [Acinetobacter baumannii]MDC5330694.1 hypothetical protein [Acinetobacter baumannii]MDC5383429.1 hypothetical protein [Acinetobacter baumannii]MDC5454058.1 hypothetical protein [Acinetobacter baumannii]MDC5525190.1 hypothetical protein [Acinetobacter baumannii]